MMAFEKVAKDNIFWLLVLAPAPTMLLIEYWILKYLFEKIYTGCRDAAKVGGAFALWPLFRNIFH